ncbi:MAG: hypothetical protein V3T30_00785 [Thermodesulfobacteriota bacterium]
MPNSLDLNRKSKPERAYLVLIFLFVVQYILFKNFVLTEVSPYYPPNHDQAGYLALTYELHSQILAAGSFSAWITELIGWLFTPSPQGKLFQVMASIIFFFTGASRLSALMVNFISFIALQASFLYILRRISGGFLVGYMGVGLILALSYPFFWAGNIYDFRIDFIAFCIYGIFTALLVGSETFLNRRWVAFASFVGIVLVLTRHVTLVYIGSIYTILLIFILLRYFLNGSYAYKRRAKARIVNIILSIISILVVTAPVLIKSRAAIVDYYFVRHFTGVDKIRALDEMMAKGMINYLMYYPRSVVGHLGGIVTFIVIILLALSVLLIFLRRPGLKRVDRRKRKPLKMPVFDKECFAFILLTILIPLIIYTIDISKTPVVAGLVLPSIILLSLVVLLYSLKSYCLERGPDSSGAEMASAAVAIISILVLLLGFNYQVEKYTHPSYLSARDNNATITEMYMDIGDYTMKHKINRPHIVYDRMADYFTDATITDIYYERNGIYIPIEIAVRTIEAYSEAKILGFFRGSDFVVFSKRRAGRTDFPYDEAMDKVRPRLKRLLTEEFKLLKKYRFNHTNYGLYVKK